MCDRPLNPHVLDGRNIWGVGCITNDFSSLLVCDRSAHYIRLLLQNCRHRNTLSHTVICSICNASPIALHRKTMICSRPCSYHCPHRVTGDHGPCAMQAAWGVGAVNIEFQLIQWRRRLTLRVPTGFGRFAKTPLVFRSHACSPKRELVEVHGILPFSHLVPLVPPLPPHYSDLQPFLP